MPLSPVDVVSPAFERMKTLLFKPFRWGQWFRLALVGFLAGEMGQSGGCSIRLPLDIASSIPRNNEFQSSGPGALVVLGIVLALLLAVILFVLLVYIGSRMRFVLFDAIIDGECRIRASWERRSDPAFRYFVFNIVFALAGIVSLAVLIGVPIAAAAGMGWFENASQHVLGFVLGGIVVGLIFVLWLVMLTVIQVLTKDFVVPQMALEGVSVSDGWSRLWSFMKAEAVGYAGYIGMKILLAIGASIVVGIAGFIAFVIVLIPFGTIGLIGFLAGRAAGLGWNPVTIAIAIVFGIILGIVLIALAALVSVPAIVFFPAYSAYFFAERYPRLHAVLYPPPPVEPDLSSSSPQL